MCKECNAVVTNAIITNNKCLKCYNSYKKTELVRNVVNPIIKKLAYYKKSAKIRNNGTTRCFIQSFFRNSKY